MKRFFQIFIFICSLLWCFSVSAEDYIDSVYTITETKEILKSTDHGENWKSVSYPNTIIPDTLKASEENILHLYSDNQEFQETISPDSGLTWTNIIKIPETVTEIISELDLENHVATWIYNDEVHVINLKFKPDYFGVFKQNIVYLPVDELESLTFDIPISEKTNLPPVKPDIILEPPGFDELMKPDIVNSNDYNIIIENLIYGPEFELEKIEKYYLQQYKDLFKPKFN